MKLCNREKEKIDHLCLTISMMGNLISQHLPLLGSQIDSLVSGAMQHLNNIDSRYDAEILKGNGDITNIKNLILRETMYHGGKLARDDAHLISNVTPTYDIPKEECLNYNSFWELLSKYISPVLLGQSSNYDAWAPEIDKLPSLPSGRLSMAAIKDGFYSQHGTWNSKTLFLVIRTTRSLERVHVIELSNGNRSVSTMTYAPMEEEWVMAEEAYAAPKQEFEEKLIAVLREAGATYSAGVTYDEFIAMADSAIADIFPDKSVSWLNCGSPMHTRSTCFYRTPRTYGTSGTVSPDNQFIHFQTDIGIYKMHFVFQQEDYTGERITVTRSDSKVAWENVHPSAQARLLRGLIASLTANEALLNELRTQNGGEIPEEKLIALKEHFEKVVEFNKSRIKQF